MTDFPRIKVTPQVAKQFANLSLRNKTHDGNYILWMSDINSVPGDTIADRTNYVGGAMLTPMEAKLERMGTATSYKQVYTPAYLNNQIEEQQSASSNANEAQKSEDTTAGDDNQQEAAKAEFNIPKVEMSAEEADEGAGSSNNTKEEEE